MINLGIVVRDIEAAADTYARLFSCVPAGPPRPLPSLGVEVLLLERDGLSLELIRPTSPDGPVARFLATRGEGVYRIAFPIGYSEDLPARWRTLGVRHWEVEGPEGKQLYMIHPDEAHGVLFEAVTDLPGTS